jgi:two-component system, OmpR family, sensor kinase
MNHTAMNRLRTASLRRRVTVSGVLVLTAVVLLLAVVTDLLFGTQSNRELRTMLQDRARLADQLALQRVNPREIAARVETPTVKIRLTTPSGEVFGSAEQPPEPPQPHNRGRQVYPAGSDLVSMRRLPGGRELVLVADGDAASNAQRRLRRLLIIVGLAAIAVAALVLTGTVRVALAPLDAMTALAKSITRGDRGRRLGPDRPQTELGRAARAFDDMLDALEGAERQARQAEAVARASEGRTRRFVADAAHELRTPIAGVQAAAEAVLQAGPATDTHERERLQLLIIREARRAGRLVEDLLSLARIDAGLELHLEPVDLLTLATTEADRTKLLAPTLTIGVTGEPLLVAAGEPMLVAADPGRVAQVLANLLDNARRHTPDGGRIDVHVTRTGPWAELTVTDTGPGVPPADRERIFDRLVRLDTARSRTGGDGAGLGLAIARGIARAHGGDLRCVDPPPGAPGAPGTPGARFALRLPLTPEAPTVPIACPA